MRRHGTSERARRPLGSSTAATRFGQRDRRYHTPTRVGEVAQEQPHQGHPDAPAGVRDNPRDEEQHDRDRRQRDGSGPQPIARHVEHGREDRGGRGYGQAEEEDPGAEAPEIAQAHLVRSASARVEAVVTPPSRYASRTAVRTGRPLYTSDRAPPLHRGWAPAARVPRHGPSGRWSCPGERRAQKWNA